MALLAFGLNHVTAPLEVREKVAFDAAALPRALSRLTGAAGIREAAILSTCNRTEVYCHLDRVDAVRPIDWFAGFHGCRGGDLGNYLYAHADAGAVKHVLRVASGLDSMVLGEPQVLGQLKQAYQAARTTGSVGKMLNRLFQHSFKVAKEVRSNTLVGSHPVSVAYAAVRLARQVFGDLSGRTALLIGAGETVELAARYLCAEGLRRMIIANRTLERAQRLAQRHGAYAVALDQVPRRLYEADIVIASTAGRAPVLDRDTAAAAMSKRRHEPVLMIDLAVPRDVEPAVGELEDVYLYAIDDLRGIIDDNLQNRRQAAAQAERIIDAEAAHFMDWMNSLDSVATVRALRAQARAAQAAVLRSALGKLRQGAAPDELLAEAARALTNKLIHAPTAGLRRLDPARREEALRLVRELFDLPSQEEEAPGPDQPE